MAIENVVVFFPCNDIEATTRFYTEICGLTKVQEQSGGACRIFDTGYGYLGFCQYSDDRPIPAGPRGMCISFNCRDEADVDRQYQRLLQLGADIVAPPCRQERFPVYAFFARDPDGYKVEFQRILLPDQELSGGRRPA